MWTVISFSCIFAHVTAMRALFYRKKPYRFSVSLTCDCFFYFPNVRECTDIGDNFVVFFCWAWAGVLRPQCCKNYRHNSGASPWSNVPFLNLSLNPPTSQSSFTACKWMIRWGTRAHFFTATQQSTGTEETFESTWSPFIGQESSPVQWWTIVIHFFCTFSMFASLAICSVVHAL